MDSVDDGAATSTGDNKRRVHGNDWRTRLHLRKAAAQPPAMQSRDKRGPKTTTAAAEKRKKSGSQKPPRGGATFENTLRFTCSQCGDASEYVPKDLVRHFEEKHGGSPPVFPCHACPFTTPELSYLQVHLLSHEDNFSSCSMCGDDVSRTWPEFAAHLTACHCANGKYWCKLCQKFSTGDVGAFLEHIYLHNLNLDAATAAADRRLLRLKEKNPLGPPAPAQAFRCQRCGYEASQKWLITKHVKAVHARQRTKGVRAVAATPGADAKPRLTRSAVREMCWLTTQDCLSLPGREFLDKYCHLSDPQTTLEETQQFLMKSVAGETGERKWTKALKTVLSNVPQDVALYAKAESGAAADAADLTVLTVKNKITVGQNGAAYAKRLRMLAASDKEAPGGAGGGEVHQNGDPSNLGDQTETRPHADVHPAAAPTENRENQEVEPDQNAEEHGGKPEGAAPAEGLRAGCDRKPTQENEETRKAPAKTKRPNRRRKRKTRFKRADRRAKGLPLKIVLKKNPAEKQWVSQSSLPPPGGDAAEARDEARGPPAEERAGCGGGGVRPAEEEQQQKKWTKGRGSDLPSEAISSTQQDKPGDDAAAAGAKNSSQSRPGDAGKSENEEGTRTEDGGLQTARCGTAEEEEEEAAADGATPHSGSKSSPVAQPVITPQGEVAVEGPCLLLPAEQRDRTVGRIQNDAVPADSLSSQSPAVPADRHQPSPAAAAAAAATASTCRRSRPAPKTLERTLKLVATNPSQPVKRPAGDQPVVVLNHPDAEIPEVARIMEVVHRYRGEVKKVMLSRRTLMALSASGPPEAETDEPSGGDSVQERFMLKLKFRRLSRKKYEIVGGGGGGEDGDEEDGAGTAPAKFRCWFCGRAFTSREAWMSHRQRHLMEWKL